MTVSRRRFLAGALALAACRSSRQPVPAPPPRDAWEPARTWLFFAGLLEFAHSDVFASFPQAGRRDVQLYERLLARGVPPSQAVFLKDRDATLAALKTTLAAHAAKAGPGDTLWIYYAGHGTRDDDGTVSFAAYDDDGDHGLRVPSIFDAVESSFRGARALLMADACHSGGLCVEATRRKRGAYACLASSLSREVSTGEWTFTECVLGAMRGEPVIDGDGDGVVSLADLAGYTEAEMAFVEGQLSTFAATGGFPRALALSPRDGAAAPRKGEHVEVRASPDDDWTRAEITGASGGELVVRMVDGDDAGSEARSPPLELRAPILVRYAKGTKVEIEWESKWWPGAVLDERLGVHLVHYNDYDDSWDEWVGKDRVRPREGKDNLAP